MKRYLMPLIFVASVVTGFAASTVHAGFQRGSGSIGSLGYKCGIKSGDRRGVCECKWADDCIDLALSGQCSGDFYCTGDVCRCIYAPFGGKVF